MADADASPPIASMTGSGAAVLEHALGRFEAEARSVNHRFLKVSVRTWGALPPLDAPIEAAVKACVQRGHVTITLRLRPAPGTGAGALDETAFELASRHLQALAARCGLPAPTVADVLRMPGLLEERAAPDVDALLAPAVEAVTRAVEDLARARAREGAALAEELLRLLDALASNLAAVAAQAGEVPRLARARIEARAQELLAGTGVEADPAQLVREAATLADRADVREEIARLEAHLVHAREVLAAGGPVGRRLDFLVQEMHRETNTIGSKTQELDVSRRVVEMKSDVERLREQVQNLE